MDVSAYKGQFLSLVRRMLGSLMRARGLVLLFIYTLVLTFSYYVSYALRFDFSVPEHHAIERDQIIWWLIPFKLSLLYALGQFSVLLTYFRMPDLFRIIRAMLLSTLFLGVMWWVFQGDYLPPRGVILSDFILSVMLLSMARLSMRLIRERLLSDQPMPKHMTLALIVGTGSVAESIASDLLERPRMGVRPVGFLDWNPERKGKDIHGVSILGTPEDLVSIARKYDVQKIILALESSQRKKATEVIQAARAGELSIEVIPSVEDLATGRVQATRLRPVQFEDLLGRDPVTLDNAIIHQMLVGKVICVTGAGGSIGSELCRQIIKQAPTCLLMIDQSETALFEIEQQLQHRGYGEKIIPYVADIRNADLMKRLLELHKPSMIFHAAAYKHVPMMEHQPWQAVSNNSLATARLAEIADACGVERFVFISTDKAINPTSVMGASKRLAEQYLQSMQQKSDNRCSFVAVRFGNVLGSSGSVIPIFKQQIAEGGPVTVTHPEAMRYFMTIPEAVGLVLQSAAIGNAGDILVLDMGGQLKIVDIARQLIRLSGFEPDVDIPIVFTGLRPGEKLYEELQHHSESYDSTDHASVMRLKGEPIGYDHACAMFDETAQWLEGYPSEAEVKARLKRYIPEYQPSKK